LEEEGGIQLFNRDPGKLSLTDAGRVFLGDAKGVLRQLDDALYAAQLVQKGKAEIVKVGIAGGLGQIIGPVLTEHSKLFPKVEVECRTMASGEQSDAVRKRDVDVAIGFLEPYHTSDLCSQFLFEERLAAAMCSSNPLGKYKSLRPQQLAGETLMPIGRDASKAIYEKGLALYKKGGGKSIIERRTLAPNLSFEDLAISLASGKGICIVAGTTTPFSTAFAEYIRTIPIQGPDAKVEVFAAWRRNEESTGVFEFVSCVEKVFRRRNNKSQK
jgi:DNA-binding transcriptional LysR family regulator